MNVMSEYNDFCSNRMLDKASLFLVSSVESAHSSVCCMINDTQNKSIHDRMSNINLPRAFPSLVRLGTNISSEHEETSMTKNAAQCN